MQCPALRRLRASQCSSVMGDLDIHRCAQRASQSLALVARSNTINRQSKGLDRGGPPGAPCTLQRESGGTDGKSITPAGRVARDVCHFVVLTNASNNWFPNRQSKTERLLYALPDILVQSMQLALGVWMRQQEPDKIPSDTISSRILNAAIGCPITEIFHYDIMSRLWRAACCCPTLPEGEDIHAARGASGHSTSCRFS